MAKPKVNKPKVEEKTKQSVTCSDCGGSGLMNEFTLCPNCDGSGSTQES